MTWSYVGPQEDSKDYVRFLVGDVVESDASVSDEEVLFLLDEENGNVYLAAANVAESMAARYLRITTASKKVGDLEINYTNAPIVAQRLYQLAARLRLGKYSSNSLSAPVIADDSGSIFKVGMNDPEGPVADRGSGWSQIG